jgi:hypothetical protein
MLIAEVLVSVEVTILVLKTSRLFVGNGNGEPAFVLPD